MTGLIAAAHAAPLWTSFESALRSTLRSLAASTATACARETMEGDQARIRNSARHWLIG